MSRKRDCLDNAVAESFFATLEWALIQDSDWHTHAEAHRAVFDSIEVWYNRERLHSGLDYRSPVEYEEQLALTRGELLNPLSVHRGSPAEVLGIAPATVKRDWSMARAWLRRELEGG